jgi:hypothetical protein
VKQKAKGEREHISGFLTNSPNDAVSPHYVFQVKTIYQKKGKKFNSTEGEISLLILVYHLLCPELSIYYNIQEGGIYYKLSIDAA